MRFSDIVKEFMAEEKLNFSASDDNHNPNVDYLPNRVYINPESLGTSKKCWCCSCDDLHGYDLVVDNRNQVIWIYGPNIDLEITAADPQLFTITRKLLAKWPAEARVKEQ